MTLTLLKNQDQCSDVIEWWLANRWRLQSLRGDCPPVNLYYV